MIYLYHKPGAPSYTRYLRELRYLENKIPWNPMNSWFLLVKSHSNHQSSHHHVATVQLQVVAPQLRSLPWEISPTTMPSSFPTSWSRRAGQRQNGEVGGGLRWFFLGVLPCFTWQKNGILPEKYRGEPWTIWILPARKTEIWALESRDII